MTTTRRNILTNPDSRKSFAKGVNLLKADFSAGVTTASLGFGGTATPVNAYDQFVLWHYVAMNTLTPNDATNLHARNAAHRGSVFLPWHRFMLLLFERHLQRVLSDDTFGLPYWDWAADGDVARPRQVASALWTEDGIGGTGIPVANGPFVVDPDPLHPSFKVFFAQDLTSGNLTFTSAGRGLNRQLGQATSFGPLPTTAQVSQALRDQTTYDTPGWDAASPGGFRNKVEGWRMSTTDPPARLHNMVHVWIGGDMSPGTSPNDPAFYLNHCNVDRIWEAWMLKHGRNYLPDETTAGAPLGHRINDDITSLVTTTTTRPADMLNVADLYTYDQLPTS